MNTPDLIKEFLSQKRFAMVGVSREAGHFSRMLFRDLGKRGFEIVPVNPAATEIDRVKCFPRVSAVQPHVSSALVMTPKKEISSVLRDCADAGVTLVWLHGISGAKEVGIEAVEFCRDKGIALIPGYCPYMFLRDAGFIHRVHGGLWRMVGLYPR